MVVVLPVVVAIPSASLSMLPLFGVHAPASARDDVRHLRLVKSEPADHDTLSVAPSAVRLWFSQRAELRTTRVTVRSATGDTVALGALTRGAGADAPVVAPIVRAPADGAYTVEWRTMAGDGHIVRGSFGFTVRGKS